MPLRRLLDVKDVTYKGVSSVNIRNIFTYLRNYWLISCEYPVVSARYSWKLTDTTQKPVYIMAQARQIPVDSTLRSRTKELQQRL